MAGSNGSHPPRGVPPPQPWPPMSEAEARQLELERWQQQQAMAQGRGYPPAAGAHALPPGYAPGHYEAPQAAPDLGLGQVPPGQHQGYAHAGYAEPAHARPADPFAPRFERYAPAAPQPQGDPYARYEPQPVQPAYPEPQHGYDPNAAPPHADPRGYPTPPPAYGSHGEADPRLDVRSLDFSHYQPGQIPVGYAGQPGAPAVDPRGWPAGHGDQAHSQWPPPHPGAGGHAGQHWQQHELTQGHPAGGYGQPQHGQYAQHELDPRHDGAHGPHDGQYETDPHEQGEPQRRGPSTMLIVGALVGAIALGGGLAVAYKQLSGGGDKGKVAEIKNTSTPAKVRPQDPGGKTVEHTDKRFLNRLASDAPSEATSRGSDVEGSAKKVSTIPIVVNRDGTLSPQAPAAAPSPSTSGVPGLVIDGMGPPPVPPSMPPLRGADGAPATNGTAAGRLPPPPPPVMPKAASVQPAAAPGAAAPPRVADLPLPRVTSAPPPPPVTAAVEKAAPPASQPAPKKRQRDDLVAQQAAGGAAGAVGAATPGAAEEGPAGLAKTPPRKPAPAASGSGFVAVLASKKSRQDALNSFADLHSQYPDILSGLTPDVREANLGEKGVWYRLIVGPPGSREAARTICVKLKERGMKDCWPVAY